jgi:PIN domain nuclease of toxin-antitoxin system
MTRVLIDTHVLLWAATTPERLGPAAALLEDGDRLVSAASVWELAIKQSLGKVGLGMPAGRWIDRARTELSLRLLDITVEHAAAVEHLPPLHRDPFDRLLIAQAEAEDAVLLTADSTLAAYGPVVRLI